MTRGCYTLSLQLDTGNFKQAWINSKNVDELWFRGEKIYKSPKFYAFGNKWSGSKINTLWGGSSMYVRPYNSNTTAIKSCIGYTSVTKSMNQSIFITNRELSSFTELQEGSIQDLRQIIGVESLTQCRAVYYVTRFKNNTYSGDIFVKPFIRTAYSSSSSDKTLGSVNYGIGTEYTNNKPNDFCWTYKAADKGTTVTNKFQLTDEQITKIEDSTTSGPYYLCQAYHTNTFSTALTKATLYYGGYLLFEVV